MDFETSPESAYTGLSTVNGQSIDIEVSLNALPTGGSARVTSYILNTRILVVGPNQNIVIKE